jgi:hypothetical protein
MISLTLENLKKSLAKHGYDFSSQQETNQLYTILNIDDQEFALFLRVYKEGDLLQIIAFIPSKITEESKSQVARLLHFYNKELDIPGFGMDEISGAIFFRTMVAAPNRKISEEELTKYLSAVQLACKTFYQSIEAIAIGAMTFDDILVKIKEVIEKQSK